MPMSIAGEASAWDRCSGLRAMRRWMVGTWRSPAASSLGGVLGVTFLNVAASSSTSCRWGRGLHSVSTPTASACWTSPSGQMSAVLFSNSHRRDRGDGARRHRPARSPACSSMLSRPVVDLAEVLAGLIPRLPKVMLLSTGGRGQMRPLSELAKLRHRRMGGGGVCTVVARRDQRCCLGYLQGQDDAATVRWRRAASPSRRRTRCRPRFRRRQIGGPSSTTVST